MAPLIFSYQALGTEWRITVWHELEPAAWTKLQEQILAVSTKFDHTYSRFIKTSFVWSVAKQQGAIAVPADFMAMLRWYFDLYRPSHQKFSPLIGFTLSDLGYDADYSLTEKPSIRPTPDLEKTVKIIDDSHIQLAEPVLFDFGALGKGYLVDKIARLLKANALEYFLVDGSGDINYQGHPDFPLRVGLEDPGDPTKVIGVLELKSGALCGSGTNRRKWGNHHHIIDPSTGRSTEGIVAAWILSESATLSDALATTLFLAEPERFSHLNFEYCLLNKDYKIKRSAGFTAELF